MENLLQQTNRGLNQLHNEMTSLGRAHRDQLEGIEGNISQGIEEIYTNCRRLEEYVFKEPAQRKQSSKLKVDQIMYDVRHIESSYKNYLHKKRNKLEEERRREELMSMKFTTNADSNDTKIAIDYALQHNDALQNADRNIGQMLYTGSSALDQMKNQRLSLKGVRKRMLDIGNSLGLSNTVMRMIDKRGTQDKWIVYGGMILTCIIIFMVVRYLT